MSVAENIAYPLKVRRLDRATIATRVRDALALVRLGGYADRRPRELSGGQQQRVAIARALVFAPDILLLDEPLGALDRKLRAEVQLELKALHARLGTTFVYVTHDQEEALSMSDRVAIMDRGRIVQTGRPGELYERPRTRFVADFLGKSNFIEVARSGARARPWPTPAAAGASCTRVPALPARRSAWRSGPSGCGSPARRPRRRRTGFPPASRVWRISDRR